LNVRSPAADVALRSSLRFLPSIERGIPLSGEDSDSIFLSSDGRFIAVERPLGFSLIATSTGRPKELTLDGIEPHSLRALVFSEDGTTVAATFVSDGVAKTGVWSTATGEARPRAITQPEPNATSGLALSSDGQWLATHSGDLLQVWNTEKNDPATQVFHAPRNTAVVRLAFSNSSKFLAAASDELRMWEWRLPREITNDRPTSIRDVTSIAFSGDERSLGFAGNGFADSWRFGSALKGTAWTGNSAPSIGFCDHGLVTANEESVSVFADGRLHSFKPGGLSLATRESSSLVVAGSMDGTVRLVDLGLERELARAVHSGPVTNVAISNDGASVVSASRHEAKVWRVAGPNDSRWSSAGLYGVIAVSADRRLVAAGTRRRGRQVPGSLVIYDAVTGARKAAVEASGLLSLTFAGSNVVATDDRRVLRVWRLRDGQLVEEHPPPFGAATWVTSTADGQTLAVADGKSVVIHEHWRNSRHKTTPVAADAAVRSLAFDKTGTRLFVGTVNGSVDVWNWRLSNRVLLWRLDHGAFITSIAPYGDLVVTAGGLSAKVWDPGRDSDTPVATFASPARVWSTAISPDGALLAVASEDGLLRLWMNWATPEPVEVVHLRLMPDPDPTGVVRPMPDRAGVQVAFAARGHLLSAQEKLLEARLWRTPDLIAVACNRLRGNVSAEARRGVCAAPFAATSVAAANEPWQIPR
jgi:WD40 repeat protein